MNKLNLTYLGGAPITQADLKWMQDSYYGAFSALADIIGDKVIVSGMIESGGIATNGWISINSELIPFIGGAIGTGEFAIVETATERIFKDGTNKPVRINRIAVFSLGGSFNYFQLKRVSKIRNIECRGDIKDIDCTAEYINEMFDSTGLGIIGKEREGWAVRNGNNGTRNACGRVNVAMQWPYVTINPGNNVWDSIYNIAGSIGGQKTRTLTQNEQGSIKVKKHNDQFSTNDSGSNATQTIVINGTTIPNQSNNLGEAGAFGSEVTIRLNNDAQPHDIRQPFIVTLSIVKL